MSTMKKFFLYTVLIIVFAIFSELLINVALNVNYKPMARKDNIESVEIETAESTLVNGRIKGKIKNSEKDFLTGKFVMIEFFSKRGNMVGKKFIPINTTQNVKTQDFQFYFELSEVDSYRVSIVNEMVGEEINISTQPLSKEEIILGTVILLIFL